MIDTSIKLDLAKEQQILNNLLKESGGFIDGKMLAPLSLSPYVLSSKKYHRLTYLCKQTLNAIEKVLRLYVENKEVQAFFPELESYRMLSCIEPEYAPWVHLARFDIVETLDGKFKVMETNCDCPGAITFTAMCRKAFEATNVSSMLFDTLPPKQPIEEENFFVKSLVNLHKEVKGSLPRNIAFLSSAYRRISSDMDPCAKIACDLGFNSKHLTIQELTSQGGKLCFDDNPIDIAFQKFDAFINDVGQVKICMYEKSPIEIAAYWESINQKEVLAVNSFPSIFVAENKKIMALLQHPDFKKHFTEEENQAIAEVCPQTFILNNSDKFITEIIRNKNNYVIKPAISTRGRGIIIGVDCDNTEWESAVCHAIDQPYVIQEYIPHVIEKVYSPTSNPTLVNMYSNIAMFIIKGEPCGMVGRASREKITNVGKSGCLRVVCIADK